MSRHTGEKQDAIPQEESACFKASPFLGGKTKPKNMELTNVYIHLAFPGAVYYAAKHLPPGTKIRHILLEKPGGAA